MIINNNNNNNNNIYILVNGKDDIPYMKCKIKAMFETNNQYINYIPWFQYPLFLVSLLGNHHILHITNL